MLGCGTPTKIIQNDLVVNCTWPTPPIPLSNTDMKGTVAQLINNLLLDKDALEDYALKVKSTKKCYDDSLGGEKK
jgi:hypothetical protein